MRDIYNGVWLTKHLGVVSDEQILNVKRNAMLALGTKVEMQIDLDNSKITCCAIDCTSEIKEESVLYIQEVVKYFLGPDWVCNVERKSNTAVGKGTKNKKPSRRRKTRTRKVG